MSADGPQRLLGRARRTPGCCRCRPVLPAASAARPHTSSVGSTMRTARDRLSSMGTIGSRWYCPTKMNVGDARVQRYRLDRVDGREDTVVLGSPASGSSPPMYSPALMPIASSSVHAVMNRMDGSSCSAAMSVFWYESGMQMTWSMPRGAQLGHDGRRLDPDPRPVSPRSCATLPRCRRSFDLGVAVQVDANDVHRRGGRRPSAPPPAPRTRPRSRYRRGRLRAAARSPATCRTC